MRQFENNSPWLYQTRKRQYPEFIAPKHGEYDSDVVVVGAGIAGIATAFFLLKYTNTTITLVEGHKIAHGATGHNAGQLTSYFERSIKSMVDEFGFEKTMHGQKMIDETWVLLEEMYTDAGLTIPFSRFIGHGGLTSIQQLEHFLDENLLRKKAGLAVEYIRVADQSVALEQLQNHIKNEEYKHLYHVVPHQEILDILETNNTKYIASLSFPKGCMNSALFCYEVILFLKDKYPDRLHIYEKSVVSKVSFHTPETDMRKGRKAVLDLGTVTLYADHVVLCTNGFQSITLIDKGGLELNTRFHHSVHGTVGYMSGYIEQLSKPPTAISYFEQPESTNADPYYYMTRRVFEYGDTNNDHIPDQNLISIGGPERILESSYAYSFYDDYPSQVAADIEKFAEKTILPNSSQIDGAIAPAREHIFTWHGLMGYTSNGVRMIGRDPKEKALLYNLGCNGVGILPSVYGARCVARLVAGESLPPSIFDVLIQ